MTSRHSPRSSAWQSSSAQLALPAPCSSLTSLAYTTNTWAGLNCSVFQQLTKLYQFLSLCSCCFLCMQCSLLVKKGSPHFPSILYQRSWLELHGKKNEWTASRPERKKQSVSLHKHTTQYIDCPKEFIKKLPEGT